VIGWGYSESGLTYNGSQLYNYLVSSGSGPLPTDPRYTFINWIPRWMSANYSASSLLREIYFDGIYTPKEELIFETQFLTPNFFGSIYSPRLGYTVSYYSPLNYIPTIILNSSSSGEVAKRSNLEGLLFEKTVPVYTIYQETLYFRNLEIVNYSTTSVSGQLDLTDMFTNDPPIPGSLVTLVNYFLDEFYFLPEDPRWNGNILNLGYNAGFTVYYQSQNQYNQIISGNTTLTIGTYQVTLNPYFFYDVWDEYSADNNYVRNKNETNTSLRYKNQQLSFLQYPNQRISASLGRGHSVIWDTTQQFTMPTSGVTDYVLPTLNQTEYITETPVKIGVNYLLQKVPDNLVQLIYRGVPVDPLSFVVSGSIIISGSRELQRANPLYLQASYTNTKYTTSVSSGFTTISREDFGSESLLLFYFDSTQIIDSFNTITNFYWNHISTDINNDQGITSFT